MNLRKRMLAGALSVALAAGMTTPVALAAEQTAESQRLAAAAQGEQGVLGTVTGFGELAENELTMAERLSVGEILDRLPETLGVYLDGSTEMTQIPVSWYCPGGYEDSNDFYFQFSPTWDEDTYPLMEGLDVERDAPYVGVYLADLNALGSISGPAGKEGAARRAVSPGSADEIFAVLTQELGMNSAAACGVLANMHAESALNPRSSCKDINGKTSYGLCQWNGSRYTRLKDWCSSNVEDYTTVAGQLRFLNYELSNGYPKVYDHLMGVEDTEEGAYDAAYYWCYYYEMPASKGKRSMERGNLARNTYWPGYGGTAVELDELPTPTLVGVTTPEITVRTGEVFHLAGTVQCSKELEKVTVGVYNAAGKQVTGSSVKPESRIFSLANVDRDVKFSKLMAGEYFYRIVAKCEGEKYSLLDHAFTVEGEGGTLGAEPDELEKPEKTGEEEHQAEAGESAPEESDQSAQEDSAAPQLTDAAKPGEEHPQGRAVTVRGKITADTALDSVAARILREDGSEATGGSAQVKGKSYDLHKLDNKVGFSKLAAGRYTYVISAQAAGEDYTLLEFPFTVTPKMPGSVKLNRASKALTVKWGKASGAEGYEVQYGRSSKLSGADVTTASGASKKLSGLAKKKRYYVRVRSFVLDQNGERSYSAFSKAVSAKTK